MQAKNLILLAGDDESWWLVDVDRLKVTIEERGLEVLVVHAPTLLGHQREEMMNGLYCSPGATLPRSCESPV